jgi:hypothetical protein
MSDKTSDASGKKMSESAKDRDDHLRGAFRLLDPLEIPRAKRHLLKGGARDRWLRQIAHQMPMHPDYTTEPPNGSRDMDSLLASLRGLGAGRRCYVVAAHSDLDDTFQDTEYAVLRAPWLFTHSTILSCIPGELALFRTALPIRHLIVRRPANLRPD